jgi:hypothetical protein
MKLACLCQIKNAILDKLGICQHKHRRMSAHEAFITVVLSSVGISEVFPTSPSNLLQRGMERKTEQGLKFQQKLRWATALAAPAGGSRLDLNWLRRARSRLGMRGSSFSFINV